MTDKLPDRIVETGGEDTESIENDITTLWNTFIAPIEKYRSLADPPRDIFSFPDNIKNIKTNAFPVENRVSTFYRMIGLPVVGGNSFYSPGFDPNRSSKDKKATINNNQSADDGQTFVKRQSLVYTVSDIMNRQDMVSATLAYCIAGKPRVFSKLDVLNMSERALILYELTSINPSLVDVITTATSYLSGTFFGQDCSGGYHALEPFQTDPFFAETVMPSSSWIAAPFLGTTKLSKRISATPEVYVSAPGIEWIITQRLTNQSIDSDFASTLAKEIKSNPTPSTNDDATLDVLQALSSQASISSSTLDDVFTGFTTTQTSIVTQFIKTIKVLVQNYVESQLVLQEVGLNINFIPEPTKKGLETIGSTIKTIPITTLEQIVLQLTLKKIVADVTGSTQSDVGSYAYPNATFEKTDDYQSELAQRQGEVQHLIDIGWQALSSIEMITGETTGLGLMDVIAVYTALWSMPIDNLLGLIDQDAAERLYKFFPTLKTSDVIARKVGNGPDVTISLIELSTLVKRILTYADDLISKTLQAPTLVNKGAL